MNHGLDQFPLDVLQRIFRSNSEDDRVKPNFSLKVSHVCRSWRSAALSCPRLWSTISVDLSKSSTLSKRNQLASFQLEHAGHVPLCVRLYSFSDLDEESSLLHAILDASPRWKTLFLEIPPVHLHILNKIKGHAPSLAHIVLVPSKTPTEMPAESYAALDFFSDLPRLRQISGPVQQLSSIPFPYKQIATCVTRPAVSVNSICQLLLRCETLKKAVIYQEDESMRVRQFEPDVHPTLSHLTFVGAPDDENNTACGVLSLMNIPSLRRLEVGAVDEELAAGIADMIQRSECVVENFRMAYIWDGISQTVIDEMPKLKRLSLFWHPTEDADGIVDFLVDDPEFLPELEKLSLQGLNMKVKDKRILTEKLKNSRPGVKLRIVSSRK